MYVCQSAKCLEQQEAAQTFGIAVRGLHSLLSTTRLERERHFEQLNVVTIARIIRELRGSYQKRKSSSRSRCAQEGAIRNLPVEANADATNTDTGHHHRYKYVQGNYATLHSHREQSRARMYPECNHLAFPDPNFSCSHHTPRHPQPSTADQASPPEWLQPDASSGCQELRVCPSWQRNTPPMPVSGT
ncbi:hypothetical protein H257_17937 [Aphanomyces astaci]|uniref:Uncharacterized protein n=1 Tax=Aphanomyces astaci TaxID=112090 RepID=W4FCQ6_APHAT|nr:hypothetical protein H257_17937 [Aphanomyces astaci]ETV65282.1 hypothetical protein H257_17937 [Aphanomyces astaci]|eukprot:XP_009845208.1 hypothetical protein H257_17937 [Aphanomyces astaci]